MLRSHMNARTVKVYDIQNMTGKNNATGEDYNRKSILFRVATRRDYLVNKKDAAGNVIMKDGKPEREYPSDFILCKATGDLADVIANNCKFVDTSGKDISRHLALEGHIETFTKNRDLEYEKEVQIEGKDYTITFTKSITEDAMIFVVTNVNFLDPKPTTASPTKVTGTEQVKITPVASSVGTVASVAVANVQTAFDDNGYMAEPGNITNDEEAPF